MSSHGFIPVQVEHSVSVGCVADFDVYVYVGLDFIRVLYPKRVRCNGIISMEDLTEAVINSLVAVAVASACQSHERYEQVSRVESNSREWKEWMSRS